MLVRNAITMLVLEFTTCLSVGVGIVPQDAVRGLRRQ
jgi:hypothetical protein